MDWKRGKKIMSQSTASPFSTHKTNVLAVYKRTDKSTELGQAINDTYRAMVSCIDPPKQQDQIYKDTVALREEYPIPESILRMNHPVRLIEKGASNNSSQSYPMQFISKQQYDEWEPNPNAPTIIGGRPFAYCMWKNSIILTKIPDKVYTLEINVGGEAVPMVADADATIFTPNWDETIKAGALARLYALIGLKDETAFWQTVYKFGFEGSEDNITGGLFMLKRLTEEKMQAPRMVVPTDF